MNSFVNNLFCDANREKAMIDELLKPVHYERPIIWNARKHTLLEVFCPEIALRNTFPDQEGLLATAFDDFYAFMACVEIAASDIGVPFRVEFENLDCKEAYKISVCADQITLSAGDTEGIRRGLVFIEDEMLRREGSFLPIGTILRKPFIQTRISRCFFTPPSHASSEGAVNELASDFDYYPDPYLNRLAHDGINGLWIGANLRDLLPSSVIPEYGVDSERWLKKLKDVVAKCRRYGIGIYLLSVEPALGNGNPAFEQYPHLHGPSMFGGRFHLFCPSTKKCREYIRESMRKLFTDVPDLAGFINITTGEGLSACGSANPCTCPKCLKTFGSHEATLAATERLVAEAMQEVAPEAKFISWTYSQRSWKRKVVQQACELRDHGVIHMQNFEDLSVVEQLGRDRVALDYWLSVVGPGQVMSDSLAINRRRGIRTFAKIQACTSHEISTVPYVPVPGLLFDKYQKMYELGISGVLQCWYFGNYPGLMNKAACELAFLPRFPDKRGFLRHLAGIYWGAQSERVVAAWECFEEAYRNFPVSVSFEWYGPMQDSPVAPLHLLPVDQPMPRTWLTRDPVGGDRIGDCLLDGHSIEEAVELTERLSTAWEKGNHLLQSLPDGNRRGRMEQKSVAAAIEILFRSGHNILRFYELRRLLGIGKGDSLAVLKQMEQIALEEIQLSKTLLPLCDADCRLGYHPEANGYKFNEEKLLQRIELVEKCLQTEFPLVQARILRGEKPLSFYQTGHPKTRVISIQREVKDIPFVNAEHAPARTTLSISEENGFLNLTLKMRDAGEDILTVYPEFRLFHPSAHFVLKQGRLEMSEQIYFSFFGKQAEERRDAIQFGYAEENGIAVYRLGMNRAGLAMEESEPFRLRISRTGRYPETLAEEGEALHHQLLKGFSSEAYALFVPLA